MTRRVIEDRPDRAAIEDLRTSVVDLADAVAGHAGPLVIVTNEVGWGVVPEHPSGRLFTDQLGWTNQAVARSVDDVILVVAGRTLRL